MGAWIRKYRIFFWIVVGMLAISFYQVSGFISAVIFVLATLIYVKALKGEGRR